MKKAVLILTIFILLGTLKSNSQTFDRDERALWLSRIWSDVSNNFYDPQRLKAIGWDSLFVSSLSLSEKADSDEEYYRLLERFLASVGDGHTQFFPAINLQTKIQSGAKHLLPITGAEYIEGKYYLTGWIADRLPAIEPPQHLVSIDGVDAEQYMLDKIIPYIAGNTLQWKRMRALEKFITDGTPGESHTLTLKGLDGNPTDVEVSYDMDFGQWSSLQRKAIKSPIKPGINIYRVKDKNDTDFFLFDLKSFHNIPITGILNSVKDEVEKSDYIVIDLRNNPGGSELAADTLLMSLLNTDTLRTYRSRCRVNNALKAAHGYGYKPEYRDYYENTAIEIMPEDVLVKKGTTLPTFLQPLYILIGSGTLSAAEDFLFPLKLHYPHRAVLVGAPTGGSTGAPLVKHMPGGNIYRICTRGAIVSEDFQQVGLQPDIMFEGSVQDYISGNDSIFGIVADHFKNL